MMKRLLGMATIGMSCLAFMLCSVGCTTNFSNPINNGSYDPDKPLIRITCQGSVPATALYRSNFYYLMVTSNGVTTRAFFTPEIVSQIISEALGVISTTSVGVSENYFDTMKANYRWRTDVVICGYTNLTDEQLHDIFQYATRPQFDSQRNATIESSEFQKSPIIRSRGPMSISPVVTMPSSMPPIVPNKDK